MSSIPAPSTALIDRTLSHVYEAYYSNNGPKVPTQHDLKIIHRDAVIWNVISKSGIGISLVTLGVAYAVRHIPYVGTPLCIVSGLTGVAIGITSYDIGKIAENINIFAHNRVSNAGGNLYSSIISNPENSKKEFTKQLCDFATQRTLVAGKIKNLLVRLQHPE